MLVKVGRSENHRHCRGKDFHHLNKNKLFMITWAPTRPELPLEVRLLAFGFVRLHWNLRVCPKRPGLGVTLVCMLVVTPPHKPAMGPRRASRNRGLGGSTRIPPGVGRNPHSFGVLGLSDFERGWGSPVEGPFVLKLLGATFVSMYLCFSLAYV